MPEMKGVTVKIPADLHAEVKAYIEAHNMTMGEFITLAVDNELHPKLELKEDKNMERMRTLAFQVPGTASKPAWIMALLAFDVPQQTSSSRSSTSTSRS